MNPMKGNPMSETAPRTSGRRRRGLLVAATAWTALLMPVTTVPLVATPAYAEGGNDATDLLQLLLGGLQGLVDGRTDMLRCPTLIGGTIGLPERPDEPGRTGVDEGNPLDAGDPSAAPRSLPRHVIFRGRTETFNRRYQFALSNGRIWFKSNTAVTGIKEPWAPLAVDPCFAGKVTGISVDDDELIAVDTDRWVYGMDGALKSPGFFNWSLRWGPPFWTGPGRKLPSGISDWSWSVVSQIEDKTWSDDAGNAHAVGDGKVSHIWTLSDHGRRITYLDPWLPTDSSYEMCGPHRGRFRSAAMSTSGSTVFLIGRHGDLFTRLYDFDIAGADPLFFSYSYDDQRGVADPRIQLPSPAWVRQPKIPGVITDRISIHKVGSGSVHRQLRVEGRRQGRAGYWHKDIRGSRWRFTATGQPLVGTRLDNPQRNSSHLGLASTEDRTYAGRVAASGAVPAASVTVRDFNTYCSPARVVVTLAGGTTIGLRLHTTDNIRQLRRARGLDDVPRMLNGVLEVAPALRRSSDPEVVAFVTALGEGRFVEANLDATREQLVFRNQSWTLGFRAR